ncbi:MAG TPA: hypothetical protein VNP92_12965 [Actinophytocola sp.]|nr:hypothetical protein [Actinophytocola sp.]
MAAAEAVIYGPPADRELPGEPGATDRSRYAAGVEHALMWAEMVTPEPPGAMSATGPASSADESRSAGGAAPRDPGSEVPAPQDLRRCRSVTAPAKLGSVDRRSTPWPP